MLDSGGDDVLSPLAHALRGAEHGPVVGFRAAGGEEYPVRFRSHGGGDGVAGGTQFPGGADAEIVQSAGIAPVFSQRFCHGLHCLRAGAGGGGIVKICFHSLFILQLKHQNRKYCESRSFCP